MPSDESVLSEMRALTHVMACVADPVTVVGANAETLLQNPASVAALPKPPPRSFAEWEAGFVLHSADGARQLPIEEWPLARALRGEDVVDFEAAVLMPEDPTQPRLLLASARPIREPDGRVSGAVLISRDVSAQRRIERELAQATRLEAVGQLAAGVAHDFNNILTAIGVLAESLSQGAVEEKQVMIANKIEQACDHGGDLVRRLLAFARKQPLAPLHVEVNALIDELIALLKPTLGRNIQIGADLGAGPLTTMVDPAQLSSALLNIAVNARDAMPEGGHLRFRTARDETNVLIEVSDTGFGIPFDQQARVFEPFYTTKDSKGTGLGLSMVYGFVTQSGGAIELRSAPGVGTTIQLRLPKV